MKIKFFLYFFISILVITSTAIIYRNISLEQLKTNIYKTQNITTSTETNKINCNGVLASQYKEDYFPKDGKIIKINCKVGEKILEGEVLALIESEESSKPYNVIALKDGTITSVSYTEGEYYDSKKPIITTEDLTLMKVIVNINSKDYEYIRLNQSAIINTQFLEFKGKVSYISPTGIGDYINSNKSYLPIEISIDKKTENLKSGLEVSASIIIDQKENIIALEENLIKKDMNGSFVYVAKDDMASKRYIKKGTKFSNKFEIIDGLYKNDTVILDPMDTLVEGQRIIPEESIPANSPLFNH